MANKDTFNNAKTLFKMHHVFAQTVAEEIGMDRAIDLSAKAIEKMGAMPDPLIIKRKTTKKYNARAAEPLVRAVYNSLGSSIKIVEESPHCVLVQCSRCPNYEAARELGIDHPVIERWCRAGRIKSVETMIKQLNPELSFRLVRFRRTAEDFCEEEIVEMIDLGISALASVNLNNNLE